MSARDYERLQDILLTIAYMHPDMPISEALPLAQNVEVAAATTVPGVFGYGTIDSQAKLVAFAESQSAVMDLLPAKPINAIKELRSLMHSRTAGEYTDFGGLKQCKDAIEEIRRARGWVV